MTPDLALTARVIINIIALVMLFGMVRLQELVEPFSRSTPLTGLATIL